MTTKLNLEAAEKLMNDRLNILMNCARSTPADKAILNGCGQMLNALGLDYILRDGKYVIIVPEN